MWARLQGTSFLTDDEKRAAIGYGPMPVETPTAVADFDTPEADDEKYNRYHDEIGRFTDAEGDVGGAAGIGRGEGGSDTPAKGPQLAQAATPGYPISILDEDKEGNGHIYERHVNKSDQFLVSRVAGSEQNFRLFSLGDKRAGSFSSLESANKLVNSTIAANEEKVQAFAKGSILTGSLPFLIIDKDFAGPTGKEAYSENGRRPQIRTTYSVRAILTRSSKSPKGITSKQLSQRTTTEVNR